MSSAGDKFDAKQLLEQQPFAEEASEVRARAIRWITATSDVTVLVCKAAEPFLQLNSRVGADLLGQYMIGMAVFKLQNKDATEQAAQEAGIASAMNAYRVMVEQKPDVKDAKLDELAEKQRVGDVAFLTNDPKCGTGRAS